MPELVAAQIAAGEVIERPAAVLKELLENAFDAGAQRITVEIERAGRERIAVHDDGAGIPAADVPLAFHRHATSKLTSVDDLSALVSYGFRGEALPAIAAAAGSLRLTTRTADAAAACEIEFELGRSGGPQPAARAPGTSVEVIDLFAGQPARRAFLAGARAERAALLRAAGDAVLANPDRSLRVVLDGRTPLEHTPSDALQPLEADDEVHDGAHLDAPLRLAAAAVFNPDAARRAFWLEAHSARGEIALDGLAGAPQDARRTRDRLRLFVNGRPVHDRRLAFAVQEAYRDWLGSGEFPLAVVRLRVPPHAVDVNVHPAKAEVKLRDPDAAFSLLQRTIRAALAEGRAAAPLRLGRSTRHADLEYAADQPQQALPGGLGRTRAVAEAAVDHTALETDHEPFTSKPSSPEQRRPQPVLPPLRTIGQLHRTFIIAEGPAGLVLVDQHGAHERIVYERLLQAANATSAAAQPLLTPILLTLDADEAVHWNTTAEQLRSLGFDAEPFGDRVLRLRAIPAACSAADAERLIRGVLAELSSDRGDPERFDRAAAATACHGSVRRGQALDQATMASLLRDLERCRNPHACPHGRPTLIEISSDDVLRKFGRK